MGIEDTVPGFQGKVKTGRDDSASEVVREKIREGIDSLRRGEGVDGEAVFDRLGAEIDQVERVKAG
jgi:Arc/MetJ-type ribon-helix-helix transcriptional regulator